MSMKSTKSLSAWPPKAMIGSLCVAVGMHWAADAKITITDGKAKAVSVHTLNSWQTKIGQSQLDEVGLGNLFPADGVKYSDRSFGID